MVGVTLPSATGAGVVATAAGPQGQPVAVGEPEREHPALGQDAGQGDHERADQQADHAETNRQ